MNPRLLRYFFPLHSYSPFRRGSGMDCLWSMLGGIVLFLFGMTLLGEHLRELSGGRAERALRRVTNSRWRGALLGFAVTAVVQSSSAVTVLAVSLADAEILSLRQIVPVMIGSNVGTTATAWLLCLRTGTSSAASPPADSGSGGNGGHRRSPELQRRHWTFAGFLRHGDDALECGSTAGAGWKYRHLCHGAAGLHRRGTKRQACGPGAPAVQSAGDGNALAAVAEFWSISRGSSHRSSGGCRRPHGIQSALRGNAPAAFRLSDGLFPIPG